MPPPNITDLLQLSVIRPQDLPKDAIIIVTLQDQNCGLTPTDKTALTDELQSVFPTQKLVLVRGLDIKVLRPDSVEAATLEEQLT